MRSFLATIIVLGVVLSFVFRDRNPSSPGRHEGGSARSPKKAKVRVKPRNAKRTSSRKEDKKLEQQLPLERVLFNDKGVRVKAIPKYRGVKAYPTIRMMQESADSGRALGFFKIYFVTDYFPRSKGKDRVRLDTAQYLQLASAPKESAVIGWIPRDKAVIWNHRIVLSPNFSRRRKAPIILYENPDAIEEFLQKGNTARSPIARYMPKQSDAGKPMPWPILDHRMVDTGNGDRQLIFKIGVVVAHDADGHRDQSLAQQGSRGQLPAISDCEYRTICSNVKKLEIMLVVDNTLSTTPFLTAIKQVINSLSDTINRDADVRFGIVLYRDYVKKIMWGNSVTRLFDFTADLQAFRKYVSTLDTAKSLSFDYPEAGYDGLKTALTKAKWSDSKASSKVVIVIADNSFHEPSSTRNPNKISAQHVISLAGSKNVRIFTLTIPGGGNSQERAKLQEQLTCLAAGTKGSCFMLSKKCHVEIASQVLQILGKEKKTIRYKTATLEGLREGKSERQIRQHTGMSIQDYTIVLEDLRKADIDVNRIRKGIPVPPSYLEGWVMPNLSGNQEDVLRRRIFVARQEVRALRLVLSELCFKLDSETGFGKSIVGRTLPFMTEGNALDTTYDLSLLRLALPINNRDGLFRFTIDELDHMSEEQRAAMKSRVERKLTLISLVCSDDRVWRFSDVFQWGFLDMQALP